MISMLPPTLKREVPGEGPTDARIVIVGEAPGAHEEIKLRPFVGPAGGVLEQCLHAAGLIRSECYLTNVVKVRPRNNDIAPYFNSAKGTFTSEGMTWVERLRDELSSLHPNVVVTCGATATAALCGISKITKFRGYFFESQGTSKCLKVLPTIHPSAALRGMYIWRYLIAADLKKAREESDSPDLVRPERTLAYGFDQVSEVLEWCDFLASQDRLSTDTEVKNYELACIGFASSPEVACTIPLDERWTLDEEVAIWRGIQKVLKSPSKKIFQNGFFDVHFMLTKCGLETEGEIEDTMIAHSVIYPELPKGLGFLGSMYCGTQAYWKDMVKFNSIKAED